jgi:hypothetical protein
MSNTTPVVAAMLDDETLKALGAERMSGDKPQGQT